jgi:hypothetical protein
MHTSTRMSLARLKMVFSSLLHSIQRSSDSMKQRYVLLANNDEGTTNCWACMPFKASHLSSYGIALLEKKRTAEMRCPWRQRGNAKHAFRCVICIKVTGLLVCSKHRVQCRDVTTWLSQPCENISSTCCMRRENESFRRRRHSL